MLLVLYYGDGLEFARTEILDDKEVIARTYHKLCGGNPTVGFAMVMYKDEARYLIHCGNEMIRVLDLKLHTNEIVLVW